MALKSVTEKKQAQAAGSFRKCTEIAVGETIKGYLTAFATNKFNEENKDFVLQDKATGAKVRYTAAGTLKYDINDGLLTEGIYTEITRKADEQRKSAATGKSYTMSVFEACQDSDDNIDTATLNSFSEPPKAQAAQVPNGTKASVTRAVEQSNIKAQAEALRNAARK